MKLHERIVDLLNSSTVFFLATIDQRGFPSIVVVSSPLWRNGLLRLQFYLDGNGETVTNIRQNSNGAVSCYRELAHESLMLKGQFSIETDYDEAQVQAHLSHYQKELAHTQPTLVVFETWSARIHANKVTKDIII